MKRPEYVSKESYWYANKHTGQDTAEIINATFKYIDKLEARVKHLESQDPDKVLLPRELTIDKSKLKCGWYITGSEWFEFKAVYKQIVKYYENQ